MSRRTIGNRRPSGTLPTIISAGIVAATALAASALPVTAQDAEILIGLDLGYWSVGTVYDGDVLRGGMERHEVLLDPDPGSAIGFSLGVRPYESAWIGGLQYTRGGATARADVCLPTIQCGEPGLAGVRLQQLTVHVGRTLWAPREAFAAEAGLALGVDRLRVSEGPLASEGWSPRGSVWAGARARVGEDVAIVLRGDAGMARTDAGALAEAMAEGSVAEESPWFPVYRIMLGFQLDVLPMMRASSPGM